MSQSPSPAACPGGPTLIDTWVLHVHARYFLPTVVPHPNMGELPLQLADAMLQAVSRSAGSLLLVLAVNGHGRTEAAERGPGGPGGRPHLRPMSGIATMQPYSQP